MADLRLALRSLRRTPRLFVFAVACLATAIGTATTVFAIVNAVDLAKGEAAREVLRRHFLGTEPAVNVKPSG